MQELTSLLKDATVAVEPEYFRLSVDGGGPIYRERVYCYELYHQMRLRWPQPCPFLLNGEVDKAAHPILRRMAADYAKPDFLIYQPGRMAGNHAILEVKSARATTAGLRKDIATLSLFRRDVGYSRAIYLIFGAVYDAVLDRLIAAYEHAQTREPIEVWVHSRPREPAVHHLTLPVQA